MGAKYHLPPPPGSYACGLDVQACIALPTCTLEGEVLSCEWMQVWHYLDIVAYLRIQVSHGASDFIV